MFQTSKNRPTAENLELHVETSEINIKCRSHLLQTKPVAAVIVAAVVVVALTRNISGDI